MNNDPYGKLTLIMNKAAMTFKRVAAASNKTTTTSNGAATPTKSGVERSTTGMWLCGGSRVPNQRWRLRKRRCSNGERVARMVALREWVAQTRVCTSGCLDDVRIT